MAGLLVSVRSAAEAKAALAGGAAVIDIKEPANGSLGRAPNSAIRSVLGVVGRHCAVSAALGELRQQEPGFAGQGLSYVKWGLSGYGRSARWQKQLIAAAELLRQSSPATRAVAVAYADWQPARAPRPADVCDFACHNHWSALLVDTWDKDGRTLLDHCTRGEITRLCLKCRASGVRIALAGSLGAHQIRLLIPTNPDWFAVRTAVCKGARRDGAVEIHRVRRLAASISHATATIPGN
jgi:(5-formylfuran-3-yl)methyl phosphate synthase